MATILKKGGRGFCPTYDVFDETRYFEPAAQSLSFQLQERESQWDDLRGHLERGDVEEFPATASIRLRRFAQTREWIFL